MSPAEFLKSYKSYGIDVQTYICIYIYIYIHIHIHTYAHIIYIYKPYGINVKTELYKLDAPFLDINIKHGLYKLSYGRNVHHGYRV